MSSNEQDKRRAEFERAMYKFGQPTGDFVDGDYTDIRGKILWSAFNAVLNDAAPELRPIPASLHEIGELLRTQDNRMTDKPIFVVLKKRAMVAHEDYDHDYIEWVDEEGIPASKAKARRLEELYQGGREKDGWRRLAVKEVDEFVTACFTERGCQEYLEANGHNLRKPFTYAYGSYRNAEFRAVRDWLMSLPSEPQAPAEPAAFLVTGGRAFRDRVFIGRDAAERTVIDRGDGSRLEPLFASAGASKEGGENAKGK